MKFSKLFMRLGLALATVLALSPASAVTTVTIGGLVFWDYFSAASSHISPGGYAAFQFDLPDPLPADAVAGGEYDVDDITNFAYELNGIDVPEALLRVTFYSAGQGGLYSLVFASQTIDFYGYDDIGSDGVLRRGVYEIAEAFDTNDDWGSGVGVTFVGGIPEPASWILMIGGFAACGVALRRRRRAVAA